MEKFKLLNQKITLSLAIQMCSNISFLIFEEYTNFILNNCLKEALVNIYDIYDKGYSVMEIIHATEEVIGKKINFSVVDKRPGDPSSLIASNEKSKQFIQWQPSFYLQAIIESAYQWRSNPIY